MRRSRPVRVCAADENITAERFHRDFVSKRLPVLLKGFARDWPAVATWSPSFFAAELGGGYLSAFPSTFLDRVEAITPVWVRRMAESRPLSALCECYSYLHHRHHSAEGAPVAAFSVYSMPRCHARCAPLLRR